MCWLVFSKTKTTFSKKFKIFERCSLSENCQNGDSFAEGATFLVKFWCTSYNFAWKVLTHKSVPPIVVKIKEHLVKVKNQAKKYQRAFWFRKNFKMRMLIPPKKLVLLPVQQKKMSCLGIHFNRKKPTFTCTLSLKGW